MEINILRRNAILLDCVCIIIAMIVLFLANRHWLPMWGLLLGALVAAACLTGSITCLMRARKLYKAKSDEQ